MNRSHLPALALAAGVALWPLASWAQAPNLGPPAGGTIGEEEPKKQGVAEKAPKEQAKLPTLPPLPPYPGQDKKKFELVTLDGYMRLRVDWFKGLNQGFHDTMASADGVPFPESLSCNDMTPNAPNTACDDNIGTTNMRVRLEPTIHLSETLSLHIQTDLLDNLVFGSTSNNATLNGGTSPNSPTGGLSTGQTSPEGGKNSPWDSIRVKQAWADVRTPLGDLRFGRMPNQWGMGIYNNAGGYDWVHGTVCTDCDYGDTADRFIFGTTIPGTNIRAGVGLDWATSSPTSGQLDIWRTRSDGQPIDLDDADDVTQYIVMFTRMDEPDVWNQTLRTGGTAFNYGLQFYHRRQDIETRAVLGETSDQTGAKYVLSNASMYIPDLWARFTTGKLVLEAEAVAIFGHVGNLVDPTMANMDLRQFGGVARLTYLMLDDDLELGAESGFATGDQWEDVQSGITNVFQANYLPRSANDTTISAFHFSPDYHVDMILWRELYGAVINAVYAKPWVRYNVTDRFNFKIAGIVSFPLEKVATPGNGSIYGIELNADVGYDNVKEGFFAGLSYGVLFPFGALDHPNTIFLDPLSFPGGASTAQTLQARFVLKF